MLRRLVILTAVVLAAIVGARCSRQPARSGIELAHIDTTCAPCKDFYQFANGRWLDTATIAADKSSAGAGQESRDRNEATLRRVLERVAADSTETDPYMLKVGRFYRACMDSTTIETAGRKPLDGTLGRIAAISNARQLQDEFAQLQLLGINAPLSVFAYTSFEDPNAVIAYAFQGGLGLPDRDYYLRTDSTSVSLRREYRDHISRTLALLGTAKADADRQADRILRLETALARSSLTAVEQRDPQKVYQKHTISDLGKLTPRIDWIAFFRELDIPSLSNPEAQLSVSPPAFFTTVDSMLTATPLPDWKAYLRWNVARRGSPYLSKPFFDEDFAFNARLTGAREPLPRWKRCAQGADQILGEALGKAYVAEAFPPEAKARMATLVNNLKAAMRDRITSNAWMGDSTRAEALRKLDKMVFKIGYPDRWRDYGELMIEEEMAHASQMFHGFAFEGKRQMAKIGHPPDRGEWQMTPPTVNAYFDPTLNEIVFPAGILQPPFFDMNADDAVNYGAIGMVIGHEISHAFDDQGRQFDADGKLRDWWTAEDGRRFTERAKVVADQYGEYVAVDTLRVNGMLTLGENIADFAGLTIAYDAYQKSLGGKDGPTIDGYTPAQRFFIGDAQAWRNKRRPEALRQLVLTDPHSPANFRVNGPLANMPEFVAAFGCTDADQMVRSGSKRAQIW
jgi:predicted metalloendopeptidase